MATLEKIRSKSGLLIAVVGVALAAFVIGDAINGLGASAGSDMNTVGSVDGVELSTLDFQEKVSLYSEISKMEGRMNFSDADLRERVWIEYLGSTLFKKKAEALGISVTKEEVSDAFMGKNIHDLVRRNPIFFNEQGVFDSLAVVNLLQFVNSNKGAVDGNGNLTEQARQAEQLNGYLKYCADNIENTLVREKVFDLMSKAMSSTKKEVNFMANLYSKNYDAVVCKKRFSAIADSTITVSDSDVNACYSKNKEDYKVEQGYRSLKLISFPIRPSQADVENAKASMEDVRKQLAEIADSDVPVLISSVSDANSQYRGVYMSDKDVDFTFKDFAFTAGKGAVSDVMFDGVYYKTAKVMSDVVSRPDSVRFSHVLVRAATLDEMQKIADSLMALVNSGTPFDSLRSASPNDMSISNGGDLGWVREGLVGFPNFDSLAFDANVGEVFTVNSNNGIHLVKITDKTAPVKKVKLAVASYMLMPSSETESDIYNKASQFVIENADLETFEKAAKDSNMYVMPLEKLTENQYRVQMFTDIRDLVRWAWEKDRSVGDVSGVYGVEVPGMGSSYVVAAVSDIVDEGYAPVSSVRREVEAQVYNEKKAELLLKELASVSEADMTDTIRGVRFGLRNLDKVGSEEALVGAICAAAEGQMSKPVVGNFGVYVFKVLSSNANPEVGESAIKVNIDNEVRSFVEGSLFSVLKKNTEIVDNRALHF